MRRLGLRRTLSGLLDEYAPRLRLWGDPSSHTASAIDDRIFDVTDFLVEAAAVAIGWAIVRRAGYPAQGVMWPKIRRGASGRSTAEPASP